MFSYSTLGPALNDLAHPHLNNHVEEPGSIDESYILNELSDILPIRASSSVQKPPRINSCWKDSEASKVDGFLQPEDKLRGIFLQKLPGKLATENALANVGVDLTEDIFAKVVNQGRLSGNAMIMFFHWALNQPKVSRNINMYHVILKALGRRKYFNHMVDVFLDMSKKGLTVKSDTLFIVLDSFVRARKVFKAIEIFHNVEIHGLKTTTETFNVLLRCLTRRSHVRLATSLLNKMKGKVQFDSMTFNLIIGGWSKFGRVRELEQNLEAMIDHGINPDSWTFSYILEGLGRARQIDGAVKIFTKLLEDGCMLTADVYNAMISNFVAVGDIDAAFEYYRLMLNSNCKPEMDTYNRLISACLKVRKVADALELFDEMLRHDFTPTTGTVTSFIEPLCGYGPPHAALTIYKKAREVGSKISLSAYKLLLMRLSRFGKCGMLLQMWDEMRDTGYSSDIQVYECIINGLCNVGQLATAVSVLEEAMRRGFCPSRLICSKLTNKLVSSNKTEAAYQILLKIRVARRKENARTYCRAKGWHF